MSSGMSTGLSMQVAQKLEMALSPQMIQSMELLQMPLMQLEQKIRQEQLENPTLEIEEIENLDNDAEANADSVADSTDLDAAEDGSEERYPGTEPDGENDDAGVYPDNDQAEGLERIDDVDYDWDDVYDDYAPARGGYGDDEDVYDPIANAPARPPSLVEHLLSQLAETPMPQRIRTLAEGMAQKLDSNGWLTVPLEETVAEEDLPVSRDELEAALEELQKLDPDGVGARNLSECLLLQLEHRPDADEVAEGIVKHHLEDLGANRLPKIAKDLKCSLDEVKSAVDVIRSLNPRPGADYADEPVVAVRPELVVDGDAESGFTVRLTSGVQPHVSDFFTAMFDHSKRGKMIRERLERDPVRSEAFKQFCEQMRRSGLAKKFREKYNNAQWLVKAVAQREKTILAVATEIVDAQKDYLAQRTNAPAPLFMQDIADRVGYDISTISRAVKDKYIDTPLGIKPLKSFFARTTGSAAPGSGDAGSSNASVMMKIKDMIEHEDKKRPLRDNEIMKRLEAEGITIKRRSIVNYREKLGYPNHSQRKVH
ncbi:MAG: RNA polymerase factor sigma-54 [Planctomycetes bacterium]|nr:RNA polymerase factor sigma-54 [Planctomycetota bacterium]